MSVIVFDGTTVAADSFCQFGKLKLQAQKLWEVRENWWVGVVGDLAVGLEYFEYLQKLWVDTTTPKPDLDMEGTTILEYQDGKIYTVDNKTLTKVPVVNLPFAIGSGKDMVLGAMYAGANPIEAITLAIEHHTELSHPIRSYKVTYDDHVPF